jgi:hypothetical protein
MTISQLRERAQLCPSDPLEARAHHDRVRADAATGNPVTEHGKHLHSTLRPWPGLGRMGECLCMSSLVIADATSAGDLEEVAA